MHPLIANENSCLPFWSHVREFAVPPSMIESATARRAVGDWAGACAAARVDVDLDLRAVGHLHGRQFAAQVRDDLRHLAPDLLRWHFPRIGPNGLVRPGLTVSLTRYDSGGPIHLVARTPPAWAAAGQRISLALWEPSRPRAGAGAHPHPRPDRRFRLDLHRHLWDARRAPELRDRAGTERTGCAVDRWAAEAALLLRADGSTGDAVTVRLTNRRRLVLKPGEAAASITEDRSRLLPVLPDAATWVLPDVELLHAGLIGADRLHPLVASALLPEHRAAGVARSPDSSASSRLVECLGATHRIGVVNGVLVPLDHDPDEIRREELLVALGGTALPCLRAIGDLGDVRARLDHGDTAGALAAVEGLRDGALREELDKAVRRRVLHGLYRAGLADFGPAPSTRDTRRREARARPRHAALR